MINKLNGFERLDKLVMERIRVPISADGIFVKHTRLLLMPHEAVDLPISDVISHSIAQAEPGNQLCQGYCKSRAQWSTLNTTVSTFRSKLWAQIFNKIGSGYALHLLKHACILQQIENNYILLSGDIGCIQEKKPRDTYIQKKQTLRGRPESLYISTDEAVHAALRGVIVTPDNRRALTRRLEKCIAKYQKLPIKAIFKSYIVEQQHRSSAAETSIMYDQVDPTYIADFLFMVSKKFLRPIFNLNSFKILKGKLVLLLKKNLFESMNHEDLSNHFQAKKFKLFADCKFLSNVCRLKILKSLMELLFNSIYLRIIDFFFYSTTAGFTRFKVLYFTRIDWNNKTGRFFKEYLKTYRPAEKTENFATLRCIPKESGFRVITNCSRLTSYRLRRTRKPRAKAVVSRGTSFDKLVDRYEDLAEILKSNDVWHAPEDCGQLFWKDARGTRGEQKSVERGFRNNSINSQVSSIVPVMRKLAVNTQGFSLLRHSHIGRTLSQFMRSKRGRMLMMKVDLAKCFDNIPHAELLSVVDQALDRDEYYVREFTVMRESRYHDRLETRYMKCSPDILYPMYMPEAQPDDLRSFGMSGFCIIKENRSTVISRSEVFRKVENAIRGSSVLYHNSHYARTVGIQQGCSISSYLCNIYFSALDREFPDLDWMIVRYVDDFLVVTEDPKHIRKFFEVAASLRNRGFVINPDKISSNFDMSQFKLSGSIKFISDHVEWCGMQIYDRGVGIKSVCKDPYFRYSVSISPFERGARALEKIKRTLGIRLSTAYINRHNRMFGECLYDALLFASRRLKVLMLRMDFINSKFVDRVLEWCVCEVERVLDARGILFDRAKVKMMANRAYEKCGIKGLRREVRCFR